MRNLHLLTILIVGIGFSTPALSKQPSQITITLESEGGGGSNYLAVKVPSKDTGEFVIKNGKIIISTIKHTYFVKKNEPGNAIVNVSLQLFEGGQKKAKLWTQDIEVSENKKVEFKPFSNVKLILAFDN